VLEHVVGPNTYYVTTTCPNTYYVTTTCPDSCDVFSVRTCSCDVISARTCSCDVISVTTCSCDVISIRTCSCDVISIRTCSFDVMYSVLSTALSKTNVNQNASFIYAIEILFSSVDFLKGERKLMLTNGKDKVDIMPLVITCLSLPWIVLKRSTTGRSNYIS
jgi:hypothetical protein